MQIAYYKADGTLFDKAIRIWTGGPYSHVEIIFSDGMWFSSSPRDGGCRFKHIAKDAKWDYQYINISPSDEDKVRAFCEKQNHKKYDWVWIFLTQLIPLNIQERNKWGCSEIVVAALQQANYIDKGIRPYSVDPNECYELLRD